jgi:hypothetical protein
MSFRLAESNSEHTWTLDGRTVTQLLVDPSAFRFQCWSLDAGLEVRLGSPFTFRSQDGRDVHIDPEQPNSIAPLLQLIRTAVAQLLVQRSGELKATFTDGSMIIAGPHPAYEAWEVTGSGLLSEIGYLCGPGGGSPWG